MEHIQGKIGRKAWEVHLGHVIRPLNTMALNAMGFGQWWRVLEGSWVRQRCDENCVPARFIWRQCKVYSEEGKDKCLKRFYFSSFAVIQQGNESLNESSRGGRCKRLLIISYPSRRWCHPQCLISVHFHRCCCRYLEAKWYCYSTIIFLHIEHIKVLMKR